MEKMAELKAQEDRENKNSPLKSYASKVFKESSVGLVSSLACTTSIRRRIFKVLALFLCLTGFLYQSGQFLAVFFRYPTSVDIDIIRPKIFNIPAYTFCHNSGLNRRIFCEKFPERCEEPGEAFCAKFENYCDENRTLVPKKQYYALNINMTLEEMIDLNVDKDEFVKVRHGFRGENVTGPFLRTRDFSEPTFLCYSYNARINSSLNPHKEKKFDLIRYPVNIFEFTVRSDEMFIPGNREGILFSIHSPFEGVNPFETGVFMKPGRTYMVFVSLEEEVLLKDPYDTNCVNYTEIWEKNGFSGPRAQNMCKQNCFADISVLCFNCVVPIFLYPRHERFCKEEDFNVRNCPDNVEDLISECSLKCRDDCTRIKYSYSVQERFTSNTDSNGDFRSDLDSTIKVEVFLEDDEIIVFKHSPKYMIVEVFSNIGGFIGCWLGINLLDITDIFEGFFRIFRYSFKRR